MLTSVTPSSVLQYQPGVELVLAGNGFLAGDGVQLDGADLPTTVQNSTTLTAQLGTLLLEDATTRRLRVVRGTRATQDLTVVVRPSPARREWFVGDALVDQTAGAETYLYIFNPSGRDASVSLHPTGLRPTQQIMVAAGTLGRTTLNTLTPGQHHSYRVDSTQPVVVFSKSWTAGNDASSATTGADPADTLLFATGQADAVAQTDLEIGNFSPVQVSVTVDSFPGGTVTSMVDPWSHLTITQNNGGTFWQRVTASAPVVVEQVVLGPGLRRSARGQGPPQTVGFLPYGVVGGTLNTRIFLVNPSSSTLVTRTIYHLSDGSSLERSNTIPANGLAVRDATLDGVGQDAQFWAQVDAEDATGFVAAATIQDSAVGVDGATYVLPATLAQDLMVPGGNSLAGWVTTVALANPQGVPATVLVEVVFEDGTRQQLNRVIAAGGMALVTQGDLLTAGFFAVRVASDVPVVGAMVSGTGDMLSGVEMVTP